MAAAADVNMKDFERHGGSGAVASATTAAAARWRLLLLLLGTVLKGFQVKDSYILKDFVDDYRILACKMNP